MKKFKMAAAFSTAMLLASPLMALASPQAVLYSASGDMMIPRLMWGFDLSHWITMLFIWILMASVIAAIWHWILSHESDHKSKKK